MTSAWIEARVESTEARAQLSGPPIRVNESEKHINIMQGQNLSRIALQTHHTPCPCPLKGLQTKLTPLESALHQKQFVKLTVVKVNRWIDAPFRRIYHSIDDHLSRKISPDAPCRCNITNSAKTFWKEGNDILAKYGPLYRTKTLA